MNDNKTNTTSPVADFCLEIRYKKGTENPSRVFHAFSDLIDSFQDIDKKLVNNIDVNIESTLLLEDIEIGSIRTWLVYALKRVPDDAAFHLDWKPLIGQYLVKAKYVLIDFLQGKSSVNNVNELKPVQEKIALLAQETHVLLVPAYNKSQPRELLDGLHKIGSVTFFV